MPKAKSIQFRFKSPVASTSTPASQSLFVSIDKTDTNQFAAVLEHTVATTSGSYSGSIINPDSVYGTLKFIHEELALSASIELPFLNGEWWSTMVTQETISGGYNYTLYAGSKVYDGVDGNTVGFQASASFTGSLDWNRSADNYMPGSSSRDISGQTYTPFTGSVQELRYFSTVITEVQFKDYVQDSNSIEGSSGLFFRAALGGELFTASSSIHPRAGGFSRVDSFITGNGFNIISGSFAPNYETALVDQVISGVRNRVSDKIKQGNLVLPDSSGEFANIPIGNVLSATRTLQQQLQVSQSFTRDVNYVEVALSPQNELNDDINATYGYFNIGEYIGDPLDYASTATTYPLLENLKNSYFLKYNTGYNLKDYTRLSKYYDNAVFQMIKDFVPVRAGVATGVVIKQHLLERNRVRPAQVSYEDLLLTGSIKPQSRGYENGTIEVFSGGPGGSVNSLVGIDQAWTASYNSPLGLVTQIESSQYEFYSGEYSGSVLTAQISYSLNEEPLLNNVSTARLSSFYEDVDYSTSITTPVNIDLILSGSAIKASVPDSNYTSLRSITPRYLGSKNTGEVNYSQSFSPTTVAPGYPVDSKTPWFAFFNGIYNSAELGSGIGGNINVSALINAETSDVITLTSDNQNIDFLGQLFKNGDFPAIVPAVADVILEGQVEVQAAGELYQTILMKSGSIGTGYLGNFYPSGALSFNYAEIGSPTPNYFYSGVAMTQSYAGSDTYIYGHSSSYYESGWMAFLTADPSNPNQGASNFPDTVQSLGSIYIYNKSSGLYSQEHLSTAQDTYFPIQPTDFIRVGTTASIDVPQQGGTKTLSSIEALGQIKAIKWDGFSGTPTGAASASVVAAFGNSGDFTDVDNQSFRVIRRVPTEFYVLVKTKPNAFTGEGLLLPHNFDNKYNARQVATTLGFIKRNQL